MVIRFVPFALLLLTACGSRTPLDKSGDGGIVSGPLGLSCEAGSLALDGTWQIRKGDDAAWAEWPADPDSKAMADYIAAFHASAEKPLGRKLLSLDGVAGPPESAMTLWYTRPAGQWVEALPVGNGRLGAMVFGDLNRERIQLNEDTLWAGGPYDPSRASARTVAKDCR